VVRRSTWLAGTRGELLLLGPAFKALGRTHHQGLHCWLLHSGEQGMAAYQALDFMGFVPDEAAPLCHPADEPAVRLNLMLERAEAFVRQRKGTHIVFTGFGPTAAGAAIYCHARGCRGLWLRPPDPAGLIPRLRWEAGLERLIRACAPCVESWQIPAMPDWSEFQAEGAPLVEAEAPLEAEIAGLRAGAPLTLIAVLRREWGYLNDTTSLLARAAAAWSAAMPDADWLVLSNLNARLEGPMRSLKARPENLLIAPPLPYPLYHRLLARARLVVTDSPLIAAEALQRGVPVATLGEIPWDAGEAAAGDETLALHNDDFSLSAERNFPIVPAYLQSETWVSEMRRILDSAPLAEAPKRDAQILERIERVIASFLEA